MYVEIKLLSVLAVLARMLMAMAVMAPLSVIGDESVYSPVVEKITEVDPVAKEVSEQDGQKQRDVSEEKITEFIDNAHSMVSAGVVSTAKWIDAFFASERYDDEENKTSLLLRFTEFVDEDGEDFKARARVRLRTPNLNKRLRLFFVGEEGDVDPGLDAAEKFEQVFEGTDKDSITAGLLYRYRESVRKNIRLKTGLRFRDGRIVSFVEPRFRWRENFTAWNFYFTQKAGWFSDNGWNAKTRFDLERPLSEYHLIRFALEGNWYEDLEGYFYQTDVQYTHLLGPDKGLSYQWHNAFFMDSDSVLNATVLRLVYRQKVWRDWLSLEIVPQMNYPREKDFEARPGLFVRFEIRFDENSNKKG